MKPLAVITGAGGGIGRALAGRFAEGGSRLLGFELDPRAAERAAGELQAQGHEARIVSLDLRAPEAVERVVEEVRRAGPADTVLHNAGINCVGPFADTVWKDQRRVLELNLRVPLRLTTALLAGDHLATGGTLVFVSSLSHFVGYPGASVYAASKDGLASYARSLRTRLAREGRNVLTVFPGPTRTEHARRYSPDNSKEERRMPPEDLADRVWHAVQARRAVLVPGIGNRLFATVGRWLPGVTEAAMRKAILERLDGAATGR